MNDAEGLVTPAHQTAYLTDAWLSGDPYLITVALKEIGTARRVPVAPDENPPLGEVLRAMAALGFAATDRLLTHMLTEHTVLLV